MQVPPAGMAASLRAGGVGLAAAVLSASKWREASSRFSEPDEDDAWDFDACCDQQAEAEPCIQEDFGYDTCGSTSSRLFIIFFIIIPFHHHLHSCSALHIFDILLLTLFPFLSIAFFLLISSLQHPQQRGSTHQGYVSSVVAQVVRDHQHPGRTLLHWSWHFRTAVSFRLSDSSRDCQSRESTSSACSSTMGVSMLLFHFKRCAFNVFRFASASVFKKMPARLSSAWFSSPSSFFLSSPSLPLYSSRPPFFSSSPRSHFHAHVFPFSIS